MDNGMIFAYFLNLSTHMWDDENTPPRYIGLPANYSENNNTDIETWDKTIAFIAERKFNTVVVDVGDGVIYESHPEISAPDAWTREFLVKKLDEMRALGLTPIPKLNFSACHHTWLKQYRNMLCTDTYYNVCRDLITEVCEIFGHPKYFHLGLDEENLSNQQYREKVIIRGEKLWWHDLYFLFDVCEKNGARPWVWSDYYWDSPALFEKYMPKSVLQSNWFYDHFIEGYKPTDYQYGGMYSYEKLDSLGYDQVPTCSTWANNHNTLQTFVWCKEKISPEHLLGFMTASWEMTTAESEFMLKNDAHRFYLARKQVYPETLEK